MGRICEEGRRGVPSTGTARTDAAIAPASVALAAAANLRAQKDWRRQAKRAELADKLTRPTPLAALNVKKGQGRRRAPRPCVTIGSGSPPALGVRAGFGERRMTERHGSIERVHFEPPRRPMARRITPSANPPRRTLTGTSSPSPWRSRSEGKGAVACRRGDRVDRGAKSCRSNACNPAPRSG
jgi:hypothetical protein